MLLELVLPLIHVVVLQTCRRRRLFVLRAWPCCEGTGHGLPSIETDSPVLPWTRSVLFLNARWNYSDTGNTIFFCIHPVRHGHHLELQVLLIDDEIGVQVN